jgi:hypothetical protein
VPDASVQFTVAPAVQQTLVERIQQSSEFLFDLDAAGARSGRAEGRHRRHPSDLGADQHRPTTGASPPIRPTPELDTYRCEKTDFDWAIPYAKLDAWRHKPEFETILRDAILKQQGRDTIMIGWNGTSVAPQTDREANPLLQDVNKGWLHKIRTVAPARWMEDGASRPMRPGDLHRLGRRAVQQDANTGAGNADTAKADYVNLDALVIDAVELLDEWQRDSTDLVVIVGRDLVHDKYFPMINTAADKAMEIERATASCVRKSRSAAFRRCACRSSRPARC